MTKRPLILITNDDGVAAPGIYSLADCVLEACRDADIYIVAPVTAQSGKSSAITVDGALRISRRDDYRTAQVYTVSGTPVDCVKLALDSILPRDPDFLFSGTNHGSNSGNAILYSGTMGAVLEGCTMGITSAGFSLLHHSIKADFSLSAPLVAKAIADIMTNGLPDGVCLNINIPARVVPKGIKACRAARGHWSQQYQRYLDPHGAPFYWLTGRFVNEEPDATDTDEYFLAQGYMSAVPATIDQTAVSDIPTIARLLEN